MRVFVICLLTVISCRPLSAVEITTGKTVGSTIREYRDEKEKEETAKRLVKPKAFAPAIDEEEIKLLPEGTEKIYITEIIIQRDKYAKSTISVKEAGMLSRDYERRALSIDNMKELAGRITQQITSQGVRAYIPQQSFTNGVMYINVVSSKQP